MQVLFEDEELDEMRQFAERHKMTLSEWVRQTLREAMRRAPNADRDGRLAAVRAASQHTFPTADIDQMLGEVARGREQH